MQFRINRGIKNIDAIRRGIADIIPLEILDLFTAEELHGLWCGQRVPLNIDHWQNLWTGYEDGVDEPTRHMFWRFVRESADDVQRDVSYLIQAMIDYH